MIRFTDNVSTWMEGENVGHHQGGEELEQRFKERRLL